jgi:outer membrane receptor protein involved in Fe transport
MSSSILPAAVSAAAIVSLALGCASGSGRGLGADEPTLSAEEIEKRPGVPIEKLLQAKSPGLTITRADDGSLVVRIRGAYSFTGTDAPLYTLDGLPFVPGEGGSLTGIDPNIIESIKVYKGSEAALYGIQGMNGVIAISTKKPDKRLR